MSDDRRDDRQYDRADDRLGALLRDAVADVEPTDQLAQIRARTAAYPSGRRRGWYVAGTAVLVAAAVVVAVAVVGRGPGTTPAPDPARSATPPDPVVETTPATVYFVGDSPDGPRLFAEQREVPVDDPVPGLLAALAEGPLDPDYRTWWTPGSFDAATTTGAAPDGGHRVGLTGAVPADLPPGMSERDARLAVQQVVYTLTEDAGRSVELVRPGGDGGPFGLDLAGPVTRAPDLESRSLVDVVSPAEGAIVSGTLTASGMASSFEATVPWELRDASGAVARTGFATAEGWMDGLHPWRTEIDLTGLAPGEYTFVAMTDDPTGGAEGPGPSTDTRAVVIE